MNRVAIFGGVSENVIIIFYTLFFPDVLIFYHIFFIASQLLGRYITWMDKKSNRCLLTNIKCGIPCRERIHVHKFLKIECGACATVCNEKCSLSITASLISAQWAKRRLKCSLYWNFFVSCYLIKLILTTRLLNIFFIFTFI